MPYLTKESFDRLQRAGNIMSNICFNLSQRVGQCDASLMREAQLAWDTAKDAMRQELIGKKLKKGMKP
jgi:hypothetical protein